MSFFKAAPAGTTILGHEWFPRDIDTSDDDYSANSEDSSSLDDMDCTADELESEDEAEEYPDLKERLEAVADASLGPDFFDADDTYISQFEEQRKKEDRHHQRLIHDARIKTMYPEVKFPVMVLGTAECLEGGMER